MEEHLAAAEGQADLYEKRHESAGAIVNVLKSSIWDLFNKIGCNTPAVRDLLGEDGVTENNVMAYLGIIEQRTNELVQVCECEYLCMSVVLCKHCGQCHLPTFWLKRAREDNSARSEAADVCLCVLLFADVCQPPADRCSRRIPACTAAHQYEQPHHYRTS